MDPVEYVKIGAPALSIAATIAGWVWRLSSKVTLLEAEMKNKPSHDAVSEMRADFARLEGKIEMFFRTVFKGGEAS
jgi:hypothetical protein